MTISLLTHRHLLHLREKKKITTSQGSSLSFATLEKKNKEMMTSQGGSPSFATREEKKR